MMKIKLFFLIFVLPVALFAQNTLTQEQVSQDYAIFKNILTSGHPSLYEYTSKSQWEHLFKEFEQEKSYIKTATDLFRSISSLANNAKDGHLIVYHPKMETVPPLFPLLLKIINGTLYADTDEFNIPVGSKIISIDGINSDEVLGRMLKYAPADGYFLTKKYREIEQEFGFLHYNEFGAKSHYSVTFKTPSNEIKTTEIEAQDFEKIKIRNVNRSSYFSSYHKNPDKTEYFKNTINQKWPYVYFIDSVKSAVLTVNIFGLDPKEFKSRLITIFKDIKKKKADNLIIDIRQNNGGYRANAIHLFSFMSDQSFKQRVSESIITSTLPEQNHIEHILSDYSKFLENYFAKSEKKNGRWVLITDQAEEMMKPNKELFKGKIYVLIGGKTFSAGNAFALNAKNDAQITLVGEETGGGYYFHTGQFPVLYKLPNSKILFHMSFIKIDHFVKDTSVPKGSGVLPDVAIELTPQDLIKGKDRQLNYVIKQIQKN